MTAPADRQALRELVIEALEDLKAVELRVLDVRQRTTITDTMIIASGTSDRHVRSLADAVVQRAKHAGHQPLGVEGQAAGDWILVDLGAVLVHIMLPRVRDFYQLEKLWTGPVASDDQLAAKRS